MAALLVVVAAVVEHLPPTARTHDHLPDCRHGHEHSGVVLAAGAAFPVWSAVSIVDLLESALTRAGHAART
jgi:hypothetical protein